MQLIWGVEMGAMQYGNGGSRTWRSTLKLAPGAQVHMSTKSLFPFRPSDAGISCMDTKWNFLLTVYDMKLGRKVHEMGPSDQSSIVYTCFENHISAQWPYEGGLLYWSVHMVQTLLQHAFHRPNVANEPFSQLIQPLRDEPSRPYPFPPSASWKVVALTGWRPWCPLVGK